MNTQNTPVHIRLWHHDFWRMSVANFLLAASVYMLIPTLPLWMMSEGGYNSAEVAAAMGVFGIGLFLLGPFCSYLVQRYRRNVVCMLSVIAMVVLLAILYDACSLSSVYANGTALVIDRLLMGATFGLAQMTLASTLIIDTSESFQRTEACHSSAWFSRFALSLGPMTGLLILHFWGFRQVVIASMACALVAVVLIRLVGFPFRTPEEDVPVVSLDRFFLPQGRVLFVSLMAITTVVGLLMSRPLSYVFYGQLMLGFLMALIAQRLVFRDAELKSEAVSGLLLIGATLLMLLTRRELDIVFYAAPLMIGLGVGIIGARFLLFFIKLSHHCQRGTSQSTYILGWESGLSLGLAIGYGLMADDHDTALTVALVLTAMLLLLYVVYIHNWFVINKNR